MLAAVQAMSFLINNTFSTSKLLTSDMHCMSHKTLFSTHWIHLSVNGFSAKSFCRQKQKTECCSLQDAFNGNIATFNVYQISMMSQWCHRNEMFVLRIRFPTKHIFFYFSYFANIPFCNLFTEQHSWYTKLHAL